MEGKQFYMIMSRGDKPGNNQTTGIVVPLLEFLGELGSSPQYHPSEENYNSGEVVDFRNGERLAALDRWPKLQKSEGIPAGARHVTLMLGPGVRDPAKAAEDYRSRMESKGFMIHDFEALD